MRPAEDAFLSKEPSGGRREDAPMDTGGGRATEHAIETYLPEPAGRRRADALCLSGGGFRAALFHLGALRRLDELGVLARVDTVSSVSGGSILAAHLADRLRPWPAVG